MVCEVSGVSKLEGCRAYTYRNSEASGHSVEVVGMLCHDGNLGHDGRARPLDAKDFRKLLQVLRASFPNAEDGVAEPGHAERAEFLVEELDAELGSQERYVLDDGQAHSPLLVFRKLDDGREKGLREQVNADNIVDLFELRDDIEADVREVVFEHLEEHG